MIKIPIYQKQIEINKQEQAIPKQIQDNSLGFASQKVKELGQSVSNTLQSFGNIFLKIKERQDENTRLSLENNFNKIIDDYLLNSKDGILNRQNENANGITKEFDSWADKQINKIVGENKKYIPYLSKIALNKRDSVISHEAGQMRNAYKLNYEGLLNRISENISMNFDNEEKLKDNIFELNDSTEKYINYMGLNSIADSVKKETYSKVLGDIISVKADTNPYKAKNILEQYKDYITTEKYQKLNKSLENIIFNEDTIKEFNNISNKYFDKNSLNYDVNNLLNEIKFDGLTEEKKQEKRKLIYSLVSEKESQFKKDKDIYDTKFTDEIINLKNQGKSKIDLINKLNKEYNEYGETDILQKRNFIDKLYDSDKASESNPNIYLALWTDIQDGKSKINNIYDAYSKGMLKESDFESLYKEHYNMINSGQKSYPNYEIIKTMVDKEIKNNLNKAKFWVTFNETMKNKDRNQDIAIADNLLKDAKGWFTGDIYQQEYKKIINDYLSKSYLSIAESEKNEILRYMLSNNIPLNKENIAKTYKQLYGK